MGNVPGVDYAAYTEPFNNAMTQAGATTFLRAAHFIAQMGHESGGLRWLEEIHDGSNYEGRNDLGNTVAGDGRRFKGRGIVQVTGRYNYGRFSQWAHGKGLVNSPTFFVDNPAQVASPRWSFLVAAWYWSAERPSLNAQADADSLDAVTRSINGGTNGLADRRQRLARAKTLGDAILPTKGGTVGFNYYTVEPHATQLTSSYNTGRGGKKIEYVTRHHMAANWNLARCVALWNTSQTSAHYTINGTGGVGQAVYDSNTAWSNGYPATNQVSISIEHANSALAPAWTISDATIIAGARWAAALCLYYKLGRPVFGKNIRDHKEFNSTSCPMHLANGGKYHQKWMNEAQSFYDKLVAKSVNPDGTPKAAGGGSQSGATNTETPKGDALSAQAEKRIELILDQLAGPEKDAAGNYKFTGWPQLGNLTIVDNAVEQNKCIADLEKTVAALKGDK
ncbi:N-acetylmuramoyl-L-alanine amidase [Corynebacterium sp.]|uniref:N-acetylmuramoyl-L-alanine amidase n=2 Tax=Corynebacterium sp. TaxID=1720 RepID=UPI0028A9F9C1|nr:N-acetylmuramoyl-L-alanine amidase [Corynebacterium sp.]